VSGCASDCVRRRTETALLLAAVLALNAAAWMPHLRLLAIVNAATALAAVVVAVTAWPHRPRRPAPGPGR
jgi:hypothetical protein